MNNLAIFSRARTQSKRCPNKMTRPFAGTTLTEIALHKLAQLQLRGYDVFFAGRGPEFKAMADAAGVPFHVRSEEGVLCDGPAQLLDEHLADDDHEWVFWLNAAVPLLRVETIINFLEQAGENPATAVIREHNYFLGEDGEEKVPLNFSDEMKEINTKVAEPVYSFAHIGHLYRRERLLTEGFYWDWKDVVYPVIPYSEELWDIDTEAEFRIGELLWTLYGVTGVAPS